MSSINLTDVTSGYNLAKINENFQEVERVINEELLHRVNADGSPNTLQADIDANSRRLYNLPKAMTGGEPLRLKDLFGDVDELLSGPELQEFIATAGQTVFTLSTPYVVGSKSIYVFRNGILLSPTEYTESGSLSITLDNGVDAGDVITVAPVAVGEANGSEEAVTAESLGSGSDVYKQKIGSSLQFRSLVAGSNVTITEGSDSITIAAASGGSGSGEANTTSNIGTGIGLAATKSGVNLPFKSITAGIGITLADDGSTVTITNNTPATAISAVNIGASGEGIYASKLGTELRFKKLVAGTNVSLVSGVDSVTINASGEVYFNVKDYGAVGNGVANDTTAIQAAITACAVTGGVVFFPAGTYVVTGSLVIDTSSNTAAIAPKVSLLGEGAGGSVIFGASGNYDLLSFVGGTSGAAMHSHQSVAGLTLFKDGSQGSVLSLSNVAFFEGQALHIRGGAIGVYGVDVLSTNFRACQILWASVGGVRMERGGVSDGFQSGPNAVVFDSCVIGNNSEYGAWFIDGGNVNFFGGSVEGNGNNASTSFGLQGSNMGLESAVAFNISGTYFENNQGRADVWVNATTRSTTSSIAGATFNRIQAARFTTNNILVEASGAGVVLGASVSGCGFRRFNDYTASDTRRTIAQSATSGAVTRVGWTSCLFGDELTDGPRMRNFSDPVHAHALLTSAGSVAPSSRYCPNISASSRLATGRYRLFFAQRSESTNPTVIATPFTAGNVATVFASDATYCDVQVRTLGNVDVDDLVNIAVFG